jgi:hypothetical protein
MKRASFISIDDEDVDLILSFALEDEALGFRSLILMRTPKFESLVIEEERGVRVSLEGQETDEEDSMLVRVTLSSKDIEIATMTGIYKVDLSKVGKEELDSVYPFLQKMNFDNKFEISHA